MEKYGTIEGADFQVIRWGSLRENLTKKRKKLYGDDGHGMG